MAKAYVIRPTEDRFWEKVRKTETCWIWTGTNDGKGYGVFMVIDQSHPPNSRGRYKSIPAHRVAWEFLIGPIPDGLYVLHNCPGGDNPLCVNPSHLWLGTHAENMADAVEKEQFRRGEGRPEAKLTESDVRRIRDLYAAGGISQKRLAMDFGICQPVICEIIARKRWRHVK